MQIKKKLQFQPENLNGRYCSGDLGVNGWMILNVDIKEIGIWIDLARNRDQLRAIMNIVANIWLCE
jgi:hypothetical protein